MQKRYAAYCDMSVAIFHKRRCILTKMGVFEMLSLYNPEHEHSPLALLSPNPTLVFKPRLAFSMFGDPTWRVVVTTQLLGRQSSAAHPLWHTVVVAARYSARAKS